MTGETREFFYEVRRFVDTLWPYYLVFDPSILKDWNIVETWGMIQNEARESKKEIPRRIKVSVEYSDGSKEYELDSWDIEVAIKNIRAQIIDVDYKVIESCNSLIVYPPREQFSAGVMCEMVEAKSLAKFVYTFYPYEPSPFLE
jgi:hypothetical protein